jgi:hypothetical protein
LYGHRNWIVIADSAYPDQAAPGIDTVVAEADELEVAGFVFELLTHSRHVTPTVFRDQELDFLRDEDIPGIEAFRGQMEVLIGQRPTQVMPHEQIIGKLAQVSQNFRVLIIKTRMAMPYTSVFLQLDCAYWPPEAEKRLRERIAANR